MNGFLSQITKNMNTGDKEGKHALISILRNVYGRNEDDDDEARVGFFSHYGEGAWDSKLIFLILFDCFNSGDPRFLGIPGPWESPQN